LPLINAISNSFCGKLIKVEYSLKFFVKHDSWDEFGEGSCIEMPVRIYQPKMNIVPDRDPN